MFNIENRIDNISAKYISLAFYKQIIITIITSTSDLQPSTAIVNQLPGQLVSTEIRTIASKH